MCQDNWKHRASGMKCATCMYFVLKQREGDGPRSEREVGRCRRNAPTIKGWPVMFDTDWCGEHKLNENAV